ncbi:MAG TPA: adenosine deaminase [Actinomycetota bacterium]|jgi:adenosine deaminase|nr:adenosine deaminase [Actinomycetota bacterium]
MDLRSLPKVELHRHLEGAIRLQTLIDLYREGGQPLAARTPEELAPEAQVLRPMRSLAEVLTYFRVAQEAFRDCAAVERIAFEAVEDLATDNVRLAELRFSPEFLCKPFELDWDRALEAIRAGVDRAGKLDVAVGLIAIVSRSYGMESAERTVAFALRNREHLVGFDLADVELPYPAAMFAGVLAPLREAGIPLTAHYGESGGPEYPREAVQALGVSRLGHGVSVAWDPAVTELVIDRGVALEMCPTSNERTRAVRTLGDHPARGLLRKGAVVTINTDDPGLFGIDLTHELSIAADVLGFDDLELRRVTANALGASFLPEAVKAEVRERHFGWVDQA